VLEERPGQRQSTFSVVETGKTPQADKDEMSFFDVKAVEVGNEEERTMLSKVRSFKNAQAGEQR